MVTEIVHFRFTTDEYEQMIATGILTEEDRVELIDGEIVAMSPIGDDHVIILNALAQLLYRKLTDKAIISIQNPIRLDDHSRPQPDIALWVQKKYRSLPGPSDILLLIEISDSTLGFDRNIKLPLYAQAYIEEVWLVNLVDERIEVYRLPEEGGYRSKLFAERGDSLSPQAFPDAIFAVADILD